MHRMLKTDQILTIPNLLSLIRLALIPVIVWLYCVRQDYHGAVFVIVLSGLTDIADGMIARKCNMVSEFGKILDPAADKLTQVAMIICLASRYDLMIPLLVEFALREVAMLVLGYLTMKQRNQVNSAQWFGKLTTVMIYAAMSILILFPGIPLWCANAMIIACGAAILVSFFMYARFYRRVLSGGKERNVSV